MRRSLLAIVGKSSSGSSTALISATMPSSSASRSLERMGGWAWRGLLKDERHATTRLRRRLYSGGGRTRVLRYTPRVR